MNYNFANITTSLAFDQIAIMLSSFDKNICFKGFCD